jgi:protein TonB
MRACGALIVTAVVLAACGQKSNETRDQVVDTTMPKSQGAAAPAAPTLVPTMPNSSTDQPAAPADQSGAVEEGAGSSMSPKPPLPPGHTIIGAQFAQLPSADDMAQYYPERAQRLEKTGTATIKCTVTDIGRLTGCAVIDEDPPAYEFGDAALKMAHLFRLNPTTADGDPVGGGTFTTKLTFKLAE